MPTNLNLCFNGCLLPHASPGCMCIDGTGIRFNAWEAQASTLDRDYHKYENISDHTGLHGNVTLKALALQLWYRHNVEKSISISLMASQCA